MSDCLETELSSESRKDKQIDLAKLFFHVSTESTFINIY